MINVENEIAVRLSNAKVLIVDDQPLNLVLLENILAEHYQLTTASSGEEALALCQSYTPDLLLLDIQMSGIDGVETCKRLKNIPRLKDTPIIFITSFHEHEDYCWEVGGVDFITKPIVKKTVYNRVKSHLTIKLQRDKLLEMVFIDSLTQVYNRRYFDTHLEKVNLSAKRSGEQYSLVVIDIDYFKQYNDIYGHLEGDKALQQVAQTISSTLKRPTDFVARFGGEEFTVVLPATNLEGAKLVAQHIIDNIAELNIPHSHSQFTYLTASAGIATTVGKQTQKEVLALADQNLYRAKQAGRNKISF